MAFFVLRSSNRLKYFAFLIFFIGLLLIVFLQYNSGQSIDRLIDGNGDLLSELEVHNNLQKLESDVLLVETKVKDAIITGDSKHLEGMKQQVDAVKTELVNIENYVDDSATETQVKELDGLVKKKLGFANEAIDSFYKRGLLSAEEIINSDKGQRLTDSIFLAVHVLDSTRDAEQSRIVQTIDNSGRQVRQRGLFLAGVAFFLCVMAFWVIINQSIQQQRLIQILDASEKKIKEISLVKEQFMANMSHEIRTPIHAVTGFTSLLQHSALDEDQQRYVQNIQSAGENLLAIVNDILDLSKIEAGMMRIEKVPFSLRGLLHSIRTMFLEKAKQKQLLLTIETEEKIPDTLEGDPVRLTQVLVNLLSNAIKFTSKGMVVVTVKAAQLEHERCQLIFSIKDTGIGIPLEKQQLIFDRFQQAETTTTRKFGGTGLGLSIVRQIIQLQGGDIAVHSQPGEGSEFIFQLSYPISQEEILSREMYVTGDLQELGTGIKVLIAEDNIMNQLLIKHLMSYWRIDYDIVGNGVEAVNAVASHPYDLVLMDIQMPEMDGYRAAETIRQQLQLKLPIIAMTAHVMPGEKEKCLSFGMDDYISKPIKEENLYQLIKTYTSAKADATTIINLQYLREISRNDLQFQQDMLRQFVKQGPEELEGLRKAIQDLDYAGIRSRAHGLITSISFMGLQQSLEPMLRRLEVIAESHADINDIQQQFDKILTTCRKAFDEANELLTS